MSSFPDFLFKLTPRDEQTTPLELVIWNSSKSGAISTLTTPEIYEVPPGKLLLINHLEAECIATAPNVIDYINIYADSISPTFTLAFKGYIGAAVYKDILINNDPVILSPGDTLYAQASFSGAIGNSLNFSFKGLLIPRGNFAV